MSTKYKSSKDVPTDALISRLNELSDAIAGGRDSLHREFTMRIPAECDRDADLVIGEAASRLARLQSEVERLRGQAAGAQGGEAVGFMPASGLNNLKAGHPARVYPVGSTPSPFERSTLVYTTPPADKPEVEWVPSDEDLIDWAGRTIERLDPHGTGMVYSDLAKAAKELFPSARSAAPDLGGEK